jgi:hypothetical protein
MKTAIGAVLAVVLAFSAVPAVANDTFHAFSTLPTVEQANMTVLSDDQLATVEGGLFVKINDVNANIAIVSQANVNYSSKSRVRQTNNAYVSQRIRD